MKDCVATTPTPASAQVPSAPTANQCDCTATPISPVAGSRATIENVCTGRSGRCSVRAGAGSFCAAALTAKSSTPKKIKAMGFTVPPDETAFFSRNVALHDRQQVYDCNAPALDSQAVIRKPFRQRSEELTSEL